MIKSDSLDNITLDSDDIKTIERFENNYYNHKNKLQNGGNNKLENNIVRLFNCYLLSQNQIGGGYNGNLTNTIQTRLDNKIAELIIHSNYLEGGVDNEVTSDQNTPVENNEETSDENNEETSDQETLVVDNEISETSVLDTKEKEKEIKQLLINKITNTNNTNNTEIVDYINQLDMSEIVSKKI
jgi:hypothetical protein